MKLHEIIKNIVFQREKDFAFSLDVRTTEVYSWSYGYTVPSPDCLSAIYLLAGQGACFPSIYEQFDRLLDLPTEKAIRIPQQVKEPTLRHYMLKTRKEAFLKLLDTLPPKQQISLLEDFGSQVRNKIDQNIKNK